MVWNNSSIQFFNTQFNPLVEVPLHNHHFSIRLLNILVFRTPVQMVVLKTLNSVVKVDLDFEVQLPTDPANVDEPRALSEGRFEKETRRKLNNVVLGLTEAGRLTSPQHNLLYNNLMFIKACKNSDE
jgi:hypothetical protein